MFNLRIILILIIGSLVFIPRQFTPSISAQTATPLEFHCALDDDMCPQVMIDGDPFATLDGNPSPFRGYGDPSLEYDVATDTLWLSYSWLNVLINIENGSPLIDFGVETHLARSDNHGESFTFVTKINEMHQVENSNQRVWVTDEVSTLVHNADGTWQVLWLRYFDPFGEPDGPEDRYGYHYVNSVAATPTELGQEPENWLSGFAPKPEIALSQDIPAELSDCVVITEPALFNDGTTTYLASHCLVIENGQRQYAKERMVLLEQTADGYEFVGNLLTYADAQYFDADILEQADISFARDGSIALIVTPIQENNDPRHQGCIALEISDLSTATVLRDSDHHPQPRAIITADGNGLGPGLCTYDAQSDTGILLIITSIDLVSKPPNIVFTMHATGIHP